MEADGRLDALPVDEFLRTNVVPRFRTLVAKAEGQLASAPSALEELRGAQCTIGWEVEGAAPAYLEIDGGRAAVGRAPVRAPLMTVRMDGASWRRFASGEVQFGFFAAPGGLGFGRARIERLSSVRGTVRFEVTALPDGGAWQCMVGFGGQVTNKPNATVSLAAETLARIQRGQLQPQAAFMQGNVRVGGDTGVVVQLGMALFM